MTSFAELLESRPRREQFTKARKDEIMCAFRRIQGGSAREGDWEQAISRYGDQAVADAFAENTWGNRGTAAGHWARFIKARGMQSEILWVDRPSSRERYEIKMLFQEFMGWLCCAIVAQEGEAMAPGATINAYARNVVALHRALDIDLSFVSETIRCFTRGREKHLVDLRGTRMKKKKNGFTVGQLSNWELIDWGPHLGRANPLRRRIVLRALVQSCFGCQWRRSDATLKAGQWVRYWRIARANVRWFDAEMREVQPSVENLRKLHRERTGYASVRSPPGKNDPTGDGATARFPSLLPLASLGTFCPGMALLEMEIDDPCYDPLYPRYREEVPLFIDPETGTAFRTKAFDKFVMWVFRESARIHENRIWTERQARKEYSLHSFRIGGCCALRSVGSPRHVRKFAGRWLSEAMGEYDRGEIMEMLYYMYHKQHAECSLLNGQPEDLPMFEEERELKGYGTYELTAGSARLSKGDLPVDWRSCPATLARALAGKRFKIMDQAISGLPQPGTGLPKRRLVYCTIKKIHEGDRKPVQITFQDPRRQDRRYSFLEFADLQIRLEDPRTGSYVELKD